MDVCYTTFYGMLFIWSKGYPVPEAISSRYDVQDMHYDLRDSDMRPRVGLVPTLRELTGLQDVYVVY